MVVTIIAVLAGLGFPMMAKMREKGKSAVCMSNVKQVGAALIMYSADNNDKLVPFNTVDASGVQTDIWTGSLAKAGYLWDTPNVGTVPCGKGVWTCPSCDFMSNGYGGYGVVEEIFRASNARMSSISRPGTTWLLGDAMIGSNPKKGWYAIWQNPTAWGSNHGPAVGRHGSLLTNVCMVDGHVEALTVPQLRDGRYTYPTK